MKSLFKLSIYGGGIYGAYTFYNNHIRTAPPSLNLQEKKNKKIVVVGAGIVGLGTAYYLSQYPDTEVVLVEKNPRPAMECSV